MSDLNSDTCAVFARPFIVRQAIHIFMYRRSKNSYFLDFGQKSVTPFAGWGLKKVLILFYVLLFTKNSLYVCTINLWSVSYELTPIINIPFMIILHNKIHYWNVSLIFSRPSYHIHVRLCNIYYYFSFLLLIYLTNILLILLLYRGSLDI